MQVRIATAKIAKFGHSDSGDTVEIVERPHGGLTAIVADGQSHGRAAKRTSRLVAAKAVALVADGARDGAVARAVHDHLFAVRDGKVSCTLSLLSVDLRSRSLVISRNANTPVLLRRAGGILVLDEPVDPIGVHEQMKPVIVEVPLEPDLVAVTYTDGVQAAGRSAGQPLGWEDLLRLVQAADPGKVQALADDLLGLALAADHHRPADDMTVLAIGICGGELSESERIRRLSVSLPL